MAQPEKGANHGRRLVAQTAAMVERQRGLVTTSRVHQAHDLGRFGMKRGMGLSCRLILGKMPKPRGLAVDPPAEIALIVPHRGAQVEGIRGIDRLAQMNDPFRMGAQQRTNVDV